MFSSIKTKLLSFWTDNEGGRRELSRKRNLDCSEEVETDDLQTPVKRRKTVKITQTVNPEPEGKVLKTLSAPFSKIVEWVVKGKLNLGESSDSHNLGNSGGTHSVTGAMQAQGPEYAVSQFSKISLRDHVTVGSRYPESLEHTKMSSRDKTKHMNAAQSDRPSCAVYSNNPSSADTRHTTQHRRALHPCNSAKPPTGRIPMYRSIYEKTFCKKPRKVLAARESIHLEEKARYAQLLQNFSSLPLSSFSCRNIFKKKSSASNVQYGKDGKFLGLPQASSKENTPTVATFQTSTAIKPRVHFSKHQTESPSCSIILDQNHSISKHRRDVNRRVPSYMQTPINTSHKSIEKIDLFSPIEQVRDSEPVKRRTPTRPAQPDFEEDDAPQIIDVIPGDSQKNTESPFISTFKKSLDTSQYWTDEWLDNLNAKIAEQKRQKQNALKVEEAKIEAFKDRRIQHEEELERRVRERIRLSEREPAAIEDVYEEEQEEAEVGFPELTEEIEEMIEGWLVAYPPGQVLVDGFRQQLTRQDIHTLAGLNWLNDEVINFYMNLLIERGEKEGFPRVHAFNTFFYPKIVSAGHSSVRRWTKKIDLFSMDLVLIPVHLGMHWCLAVVDFTKKTVQYFDSMGGTNNNGLRAIMEYLKAESLDKKKSAFDTSGWSMECVKDIPQQMNGSDCGMFACKFAEYITRNAEFNFSQEHMPYFRRRMVYEIVTKQLL